MWFFVFHFTFTACVHAALLVYVKCWYWCWCRCTLCVSTLYTLLIYIKSVIKFILMRLNSILAIRELSLFAYVILWTYDYRCLVFSSTLLRFFSFASISSLFIHRFESQPEWKNGLYFILEFVIPFSALTIFAISKWNKLQNDSQSFAPTNPICECMSFSILLSIYSAWFLFFVQCARRTRLSVCDIRIICMNFNS